MAADQRQPLQYYLDLEYRYTVVPDDGSWFIRFPDLPGCMTQVEDAADIPKAAEEVRTLWIEGEYEDGADIPEPSGTVSRYSGKFQVRIPKSLHRDLAEQAEREGVSLNALVTYLLAERRASGAAANPSRVTAGSWFDSSAASKARSGRSESPRLTVVNRSRGVA